MAARRASSLDAIGETLSPQQGRGPADPGGARGFRSVESPWPVSSPLRSCVTAALVAPVALAATVVGVGHHVGQIDHVALQLRDLRLVTGDGRPNLGHRPEM